MCTQEELALLARFRDERLKRSDLDRADLQRYARLKAKKYVTLGFEDSVIYITSAGLDALSAAERAAEEAAEQKRQRADDRELDHKRQRKDARRSWWQLLVQVAVSLFTFFLGAFLAGQTTFMDWFLYLFR